ncbi:MAG: peptidylprolyl isomerase [Flavobacteriaceae bacterium]|tara:strand:- start:1673 stop:3787 length:2115 start_codon:yes stop_codon:yes gene_type:complete
MAILGKIRERSIFLIIVIGLALFAFVISGVFDGGSSNLGPDDPIGIINDEEVDFELFRQLVDQTERSSNYSPIQSLNLVWDQFLRSTIFDQEYKKLGIDAGKDQIEQIISSNQSIVQDTRFLNEAGFFDFGIFTDFISQLRIENPTAYQTWKNQEKSIISLAKQNIYFNLIKSSSGLTDEEARETYHFQNDNINIKFVNIPFEIIPDSLVKVSDSEIRKYVNDNSKIYERDETRNIQYVLFDDEATESDITDIRLHLESLVDERISYNNVSKLTDTIAGLKSTTKIREFIEDNSDLLFDSIYKPKGNLNNEYSEILFGLSKGEVFGPYRDKEYLKISKLIDFKNNASIRASHILISYDGATRSQLKNPRTKKEAKSIANKVYRLARRDPNNFVQLAKEKSDSPSKNIGGDLGFFQEGQMAQEFYNFCNKSKVGRIGLVETEFGFHIIKVTDKDNLALFADVSKKIVPSEKTSNEIFRKATQLEMDSKKEGNFEYAAKSKNYTSIPVVNIEKLEEVLPGLFRQRNIVKWVFEKETKIKDIKRFNLTDGGYAVVQLTSRNPEGISSIEEVRDEVTKILLKKKKIEVIKKRFKSKSSLEALIENNDFLIETATAVNQQNPTIPGYGNEPYVIGAAFSLKENQISNLLEGNNGVYKILLIKKNQAIDIGNYQNFGLSVRDSKDENIPESIFNALNSVAEIEDNRALYY